MKKLLLTLFIFLFCLSTTAQRGFYLIDSFKLTGTLIIDEIGDQLFFLSEKEILGSHSSYRHFLRSPQIKSALNLVDPFWIIKSIENDTAFQYYPLIVSIVSFSKLFRINGLVPYQKLFERNGKVCYSLSIDCLLGLALIRKSLLPQKYNKKCQPEYVARYFPLRIR